MPLGRLSIYSSTVFSFEELHELLELSMSEIRVQYEKAEGVPFTECQFLH